MAKTSQIQIAELKTRRANFSGRAQPASVSFGGTTIYARNEAVLQQVISALQDLILKLLGQHLILPRASLNKLMREALGEDLERPILGALLGRLLSLGKVQALVCLTVNSLTFSVYVSADRLAELAEKVRAAEELLCKNGTMSPREMQTVCFPSREWGTYTACHFVLSNLAYRGLAVFLDKELFAFPKEVYDALRKLSH